MWKLKLHYNAHASETVSLQQNSVLILYLNKHFKNNNNIIAILNYNNYNIHLQLFLVHIYPKIVLYNQIQRIVVQF